MWGKCDFKSRGKKILQKYKIKITTVSLEIILEHANEGTPVLSKCSACIDRRTSSDQTAYLGRPK